MIPLRQIKAKLKQVGFLLAPLALLLFVAAPTVVAQEVPVETEDQVLSQNETGQTIQVPIEVSNLDAVSDIETYQFDIDATSDLTVEGFETAGTLTEAANLNISSSVDSDGQGATLAALAFEDNARPLNDVDDSGTLVILELRADNNSGGTVSLPPGEFTFAGGDVTPDLGNANFDVTVAENRVRIEDNTVRAESESTLSVSASDLSGEGIVSFDLSIQFPSEVSPKGSSPASIASEEASSDDFSVSSNFDDGTGVLSISAISVDGNQVGDELKGGGNIVDIALSGVSSGGNFDITFNEGQSGFQDANQDPAGNVSLVNGTLTVEANADPTAENDAVTTNEDNSVSGDVLSNDTDPNGDDLTASVVDGVDNGTLTLNEGGSFTYDPNGEFEDLADGESDTETFTYTASDGFGGSDQATVTVTINGVEDETITAIADQTIDELDQGDEGLDVSFTVDDEDPDTDPSALTATATSDNADLVPDENLQVTDPDGSPAGERLLTVTPIADSNGTANVTVTVDGEVGASETFALTVDPVNDAPIAVDDSYGTSGDPVEEVLENEVLSVNAPNGLLANDRHPDGEQFSVSSALVSTPGNGTVSLSGNGSFTYTPNEDFAGTDQFTYQVSDGDSTDTATATITVEQVNDKPTLSELTDQTIDEDEQISVGFTIGDVETDLADLALATQSDNADLVPNDSIDLSGSGADRTLTVTPTADSNGTATISLTVTDQEVDGKAAKDSTQSFELTVDPVNDPPVARDDTFSTPEDSTLTVEAPGVLENDSDVESATLTASVVSEPSDGSLTLEEDGAFTYDPNEGFNGTDSFEYEATDSGDSTDTAAVQIEVQADTDPTISGLDGADTTINENESTGPIEFTVDDAETAPADLSVTGESDNADLVPNDSIAFGGSGTDRTVTVTPSANSNGTANITVTVEDEGQNTASQTFTLTVESVNSPPTISGLPEADTIDEDGSAGPIGFQVSDVESDSTALTLSGSSGNTDLVPDDSIEIGADGVTVTPRPDSNGTADITITATDPGGESTDETFTLEVEPVPDAPVAVNDTFSVDENDELVRSAANGFLANDFHPDGEDFQASPFALSGPENGEVNIGSDGSFRYTPAEGFSGTDQFVYQISDGDSTGTGTVTINVEAIEVTISGSVSYPGEGDTGLTDGRPLSGVPVQVSAVSGSESAMDTTGTDGTFSVSVGTGEYVVAPQIDRDVPSGEINATDANRTIGAYLGSNPFAGDFQAEVADVNESGNANATDALKMALFFGDPAGTTFEAGDWAATTDTADVTGGTDASVSVRAAAYGDADLSGAEQGGSSAVATASSASSSAATAEKADLRGVETGKTFEVPVRLESGGTLGSYSLQVDFPADKVSFEGIAGTDRNVMSTAEEGTVRLSWFDQSGEQPMKLGAGASLVTLRFSAAEGVEKGTAVTPTVETGELAGPGAQPLTSAELSVEGVEIGSLPDEFALKGNYPNPVASGPAQIEMDLPSRTSVTVEVYNVLGQRVQTIERSMAAGTGQTVRVDGSQLASGQYFYRVKADLQNGTAEGTGRITVVR